jgi:hypothetical protein
MLLSSAAKLLEGHIGPVVSNGVCWGTLSTLDAALSQFSELEIELELLGSGRNADLIEDQVVAL